MLKRFLSNTRGATAVEYGLIVAVLSLVFVASLNNFTNAFQNMFGGATTTIESSRQ